MKYVVEKIRSVNKNATVYITERGTSFGYNKLLVDFSAVNILKDFCDGVFLDCTHSTQGSFGKTTGGDRELAKKYALSANIFEYDGVFIETHPNPNEAISDKDSQIELEWIKDNIHRI
jgi:2-dehydro-3-deoxyphosphooctonate aldolase (KDO 8-P synthase)